jgi:hypothetical protein
MDHVGLLKRAFNITRRYRVLWIFGVLLALFSGAGGGNGGGRGNIQLPAEWLPSALSPEIIDPRRIIGIAVACCCLLLLLAIAGVIISYVAKTALYRMVDTIEETGECPSWRQGFRLGWSNRALRLLGIDLAIGVPFAVAAILVLALAASPLFLLMLEGEAMTILAIVLTVGLGLLAILAIIVGGVIVNLLMEFMHRQAVLEGQTVGRSIVLGYHMVRASFKDAVVMWLLMFGVGLAWAIVMIPVSLFVLILAAAVGALPAWLIWRSTELVWPALLWGIPVFFLIGVPPLVFLSGLYAVYQSSLWTLTFREFRARQQALPGTPEDEPDWGETGEGESLESEAAALEVRPADTEPPTEPEAS